MSWLVTAQIRVANVIGFSDVGKANIGSDGAVVSQTSDDTAVVPPKPQLGGGASLLPNE